MEESWNVAKDSPLGALADARRAEEQNRSKALGHGGVRCEVYVVFGVWFSVFGVSHGATVC